MRELSLAERLAERSPSHRDAGGPTSARWRRAAGRRVSRRRLLHAASGGLAAVSLVACSTAAKKSASPGSGAGAAGAGQPRPGGVYQGYMVTNATLDPITLSTAQTDEIAGAVMSRLFRFKTGPDPNTITNHDTEPDLAVSAESPDAVTWTFKLRPNARFQNLAPVNGHAVEAEDVKSSFVRALTVPTNPNRGALAMVDPQQIQTPDAHTVVFKLNYPYAPFTKTVASPVYSWIFPREALAGGYDPSKTIIGSGPFTLASATPDVGYVLKKNPDWFEAGRPYVDQVNLAVIPETAQQMAQFSSGHLDEVSVGGNDLGTMKQNNPKATVLTIVPALAGSIYMQVSDPTSAFHDDRVRQALSMAIDRAAIMKAVYNNQAENGLFVQPSLGKWALKMSQLDTATAAYYQYNLADAKKLLQAAGVLDQTFKFAFVGDGQGTSALYWYTPTATAVHNMLVATGLKVEQFPIQWSRDFLDAGKGYRQGYFPKDTMSFSGQQPFTEVDEVIFSFFDSQSTQNETNVRDPALDAMIAKARTIVDENDRLTAYLNIQKYIAGKVYVAVGPGGYTYTLVQPRVKNYQFGTQQGEVVETYSKVWLTQ
jgi:peptide/nickel transport system substrate-binding protein